MFIFGLRKYYNKKRRRSFCCDDKSEDIYLDQLEIQDLRQVYENTTLSSYISTDPIAIVNEKLNQINFKKQQILIELEQLKNG